MPFEILDASGYIRRYAVVHPWDWFTEVEQGRPLMLIVFVGQHAITDHAPAGGGTPVDGLLTITGAPLQLVPPDKKDGAFSTTPENPLGPHLWPKYLAVFVEGIDPTDQRARRRRGFSTDLRPYDDTPLEWMRDPDPLLFTGELELLRTVVDEVKNRFLAKYNALHGTALTLDQVVDPDQVFVVGVGRGADLALQALRDPLELFAGAALTVTTDGGTIGGHKVADARASNVDVLPLPAGLNNKCIFAICGHRTRVGSKLDDAASDLPTESEVSRDDLLDNGISPGRADELVRLDYSVIGSLAPWRTMMSALPGLFSKPPTDPFPLDPGKVSETETSTGTRADGRIRVWFHHHLDAHEAWPSKTRDPTVPYEGMTEIWRFFSTYNPLK